jgi:uncharacterized membrane protein (Fun14 family)
LGCNRNNIIKNDIIGTSFSAGGGSAVGYAIKKDMKIGAVVVGLFVAGLAYVSYNYFCIDSSSNTYFCGFGRLS